MHRVHIAKSDTAGGSGANFLVEWSASPAYRRRSMLVITSSLAFIIEGGSHSSEAFSSIPAAMYWAIITMTTVGYGDIVPATALGRLLTGGIAVLSLGMVAIPTGILASGFTSALHRRREQVEDKIQDALTDGVLTTFIAVRARVRSLIHGMAWSQRGSMRPNLSTAWKNCRANARCCSTHVAADLDY